MKNVKSMRSIHMSNLLKFTIIYWIRRILNITDKGLKSNFRKSLQEFRNLQLFRNAVEFLHEDEDPTADFAVERIREHLM